MSELSHSLQCIWTAVSRVWHLKNAKESTGARVWHPLERFHFFFCRCNIEIHYQGGSNKSHKYKGRGDRRRAAGGYCDLTWTCPRAFRTTFAVGQQREGGRAQPGIYLCLWESKANRESEHKTQTLCLRDKAGPKLLGRGQKNASSAPHLPPDPSPFRACSIHRVCVCWRLQS